MPQPNPKLELREKKNSPWPIVAIIVALLILAAIFWFTPSPRKVLNATPPKNAEIPNQPTGDQLKMVISRVQPSPAADRQNEDVTVEGELYNTGDTAITGMMMQGAFMDAKGNVVLNQTQQVQALTPQNKNKKMNEATMAFAQEPLDPQGMRGFRVTFNKVPPTWNKQRPELNIINVKTQQIQPQGRPNPADIKR